MTVVSRAGIRFPLLQMTTEFNERCTELGISLVQLRDRTTTRATSLGAEWDAAATDNARVDVPTPLSQINVGLEDLHDLLAEEAITQLALLCKTRGQLGELRDLLLRHKQQEVIAHLEDCHGAHKIREKLQLATMTPKQRFPLLEQLNMRTVLAIKNSPSEQSRLASEFNRLICKPRPRHGR